MNTRFTITAIALAASLATGAQAESWVNANVNGFGNGMLITDSGSGTQITAFMNGFAQSANIHTQDQNSTVVTRSEGRLNNLAVGASGFGSSVGVAQLGVGHTGVINAHNGGTASLQQIGIGHTGVINAHNGGIASLQQIGIGHTANIAVNGNSVVQVIQRGN